MYPVPVPTACVESLNSFLVQSVLCHSVNRIIPDELFNSQVRHKDRKAPQSAKGRDGKQQDAQRGNEKKRKAEHDLSMVSSTHSFSVRVVFWNRAIGLDLETFFLKQAEVPRISNGRLVQPSWFCGWW